MTILMKVVVNLIARCDWQSPFFKFGVRFTESMRLFVGDGTRGVRIDLILEGVGSCFV